MKVRQVEVTDSDRISAQIFFQALCQFYDLSEAQALDMFARTGDLTVSNYKPWVKEIDCWELNPEHESALRALDVNDIKIGCSYKTMEECEKQYDLIVIDTPQGIHSDWQGVPQVEHFGVLNKVAKLMKDRCLIVLYVNMYPYNKEEVGSVGYDEYDEYNFENWMEVRKDFYEEFSPITEATALAAYELFFEAHDYVVKSVMLIPCLSDTGGEPYAFRVALDLQSISGV